MRTLRMKNWTLDEKTVENFTECHLNISNFSPGFSYLGALVLLSPLPSFWQCFPTLEDSPLALRPPGTLPYPSLPPNLAYYISVLFAHMPPRQVCHCTSPVVVQWSARLSPQLAHWKQWLLYSLSYPQQHAAPRSEWLFMPLEFEC